VAIQSKKCAMCRAQIPSDYLDHPILLDKNVPQQSSPEYSNKDYQWYYEGRNGKKYLNLYYLFLLSISCHQHSRLQIINTFETILGLIMKLWSQCTVNRTSVYTL
jgi:hypothetical protein